MRRRRATVATPGKLQCKTGGVRRLAVANGPNIFSNASCFVIVYKKLVKVYQTFTRIWRTIIKH